MIEAAKISVPVSLLCIEADKDLWRELDHRMGPMPFARTRHCTFLQSLDEVEKRASKESVFLYIDPYTVEGLEWGAMDRVFSQLAKSGMSIEVLLNFNAASFVRRGLAALELAVPGVDPEDEDADEIDAIDLGSPSIDRLTNPASIY